MRKQVEIQRGGFLAKLHNLCKFCVQEQLLFLLIPRRGPGQFVWHRKLKVFYLSAFESPAYHPGILISPQTEYLFIWRQQKRIINLFKWFNITKNLFSLEGKRPHKFLSKRQFPNITSISSIFFRELICAKWFVCGFLWVFWGVFLLGVFCCFLVLWGFFLFFVFLLVNSYVKWIYTVFTATSH